MKSIKKLFAATVAVLALGFGFASCSDDDEEEIKTVATFYGTANEDGVYTEDGASVDVSITISITATFYNNGEYKIDQNASGVVKADSAKGLYSMDGTIEIGTYTGDPSKDGTIKTKTTQEYDDDSEKLVAVKNATEDSFEIKNGAVTLNLNEDGEFNDFGINDFNITLKRQ